MMGNRINLLLGRLIAAMTLLLASALAVPLAFAASVPSIPADPIPADGSTSQTVTPLLKWNTVITTPTVSVVAHPKVLFYTANTLTVVTSGTVNAIRSSFSDFTPSYTTSSDTSTLANLLADKQVFIVPVQPASYIQQMSAFGTGIGPVLRQFVKNGGLVVVTDASGSNGSVEFLAAAGLMNATYHADFSSSRTVQLASSASITQDLPTTFSARLTCDYSSVGDAQVLVADSVTSEAVVAMKTIGAGHVLLMGWPYTRASAAESRLIANAVKDLSLSPGTDFENYDVYFSATNPPTTPLKTHTYSNQISPGMLSYATNYYWKVVAHNSAGDTEGPVWMFRTGPSPALPGAPLQPSPPDQGTWIPKITQLFWKAGAYTASYSIRLDTSNPPVTEVATGSTQTSYTPAPLANNTTYYWQVIEHNDIGDTAGPIWSFTTQSAPGTPINPSPEDAATSVAITTKLQWASGTPDTTRTVQVAFFTAHCDLNNQYPHTLAAIRKYAPDIQVTNITAEDTPTLAATLVGKDVFVMVHQKNWAGAAISAYGTKAGPVLKPFIQNGGLVVVTDGGGMAQFMNRSGLMSIGLYSIKGDQIGETYGSNPILQGLSYYFAAVRNSINYTYFDGQPLVMQSWYPYHGIAGIKTIGAGNVLLLGWDYETWSTDEARLLTNAITMLPAVSDESYDVYFGATNPPTTKLMDHKKLTQCDPGALGYSTTYYWQVVAHNAAGDTSGPVWSFRTADPPLPAIPSNPTPSNQATNVPVASGLSWSAGSIPATFSVKFGTTNPPTAQVASGLTQPNFNPGPLNLNTTYYWQVTATNLTGSTAGPVWSFSTPTLPSTPVNLQPANNATGVALNTMLAWSAAVGATSYDIYFGTTNPPAEKIVSGTLSTQCSLNALSYSTTYYWRVVARNAYGSTDGPVWSFRTANPPAPSAPSNPSPADLAVIVPTTTTLSWSASTNVVSYSIKLDKKNPPVAQAATGLTQTSFKPATLELHTTYYWRVTATNSTGSTDGPVWSFTTTPTPMVANPLPANGSTGVAVNTQLQWNTTTDPVKVLAFTGHIAGGSSSQYQKTLTAIREHFTNFAITETTSESAAALQSQLVGKQIFFMPNQDNWTESAMGTFGTNVGPVLKNFVEGGGMMIVLDYSPCANAFWLNTGLMHVESLTTTFKDTGFVTVWNGITEGLTSDGIYPIYLTPYSNIGDAVSLLRTGYWYNCSVMAFKRIGAGSVLSSSLSFSTTRYETGLLMANAIKNHPTTLYDVYFGTTNPPTTKKVTGIDTAHWSPGTLAYATTYYWRVVAHNPYGDTTGPVWSFRTMNLPAPAAPSQPNPIDKQVFVPATTKLSWAAPPIPATFSVKFGKTNPPTTQIASGLTTSTCSPGILSTATTYYWQVTATNAAGTKAGPVWTFSTPGLAHMPVNVGPLDKAVRVPLYATLCWNTNSTVTLPVQVLALKAQAQGNTFYRTIESIRPTFGNFVVTETRDEDPAKLALQLAGKQVFLLPRENFWTATQFGAFGTKMASVLQSFVQAGGLVVVCDWSATSGVTNFLNNSGLMSVTPNTKTTSANARVATSHIITQAVPSTFTVIPDYVLYDSVGNATVLIKDTLSGNPFVAFKTIGTGGVLLMGWDYMDYNSKMGLVLANAVQYIGGGGIGIEHYDVYFGTTNPPTTKLVQGNTYKTFCNTPVLQYGKTYYWRVVVHNVYGDKTGPIWSFTATGRTSVDSQAWLPYQ